MQKSWNKTCNWCTKEYTTPHRAQMYCSEECKKERKLLEKKEYLERTCPDCQNNRFLILEVIKKAENGAAGHYRVECTVCQFTEVAISKNKYVKETNLKKGKVDRNYRYDE